MPPRNFKNDMLVAAWLFVLGSAIFLALSLYVATVPNNGISKENESMIPYWCMVASGALFMLGSFLYVRSFSTPAPLRSAPFDWGWMQLGGCCERHCSPDLLLASWVFFLACWPPVFAAVYLLTEDSTLLFNWGGLLGTCLFVFATAYFVKVPNLVFANGIYPLFVTVAPSYALPFAFPPQFHKSQRKTPLHHASRAATRRGACLSGVVVAWED